MSLILNARRARPSRQSQTPVRVGVVVGVFVAILAVEWLFIHDHFFAPAPLVDDPFSGAGLIQLAPDRHGRCAQLRLDNASGAITPEGVRRCDDLITALPPGWSVSSTDGRPTMNGGSEVQQRLDGIRRHFNAR